MTTGPRRRLTGALIIAVCLLAGPVAAPASSAGTRPWSPGFRAAVAYAQRRQAGGIAFAVRTPHRVWGYRSGATYPSASVVKAMLLVAYLDRPSVARRPLNSNDLAMLSPMIRWSSDRAADQVHNIVGSAGLNWVARRAGMRRFRASPIWGRSSIDAWDQSRFMLWIDRFIVARHRAAAMQLLSSVIRPQRWGLATVHVYGWKLYFKSGWGAGTGWVDHQVAQLRRGAMRVSVAILTYHDPNHPYGEETLRGIAARLLRGLGPRSRVET